MRGVCVVLVGLSGACTPTGPTPVEVEVTPVIEPPTKAEPVARVVARGPVRTHLLALRHTKEATRMQVLPLRIGAKGLEAGAEVDRPAYPIRPGYFVSLVAHGGGTRWVSFEDDVGVQIVVAHVVGAAETKKVEPPKSVSAMHMVGDGVIAGAGNTIGWIDLTAPTLAWEEVFARPDLRMKAYDVFAQSGEWLVAIDDMVEPYYADSFTLDDRGRPGHTAGWTLPSLTNGHYSLAVLGQSGTRDGVLFTVARYAVREGEGQILAHLKITDDTMNYAKSQGFTSLNHDSGAIDEIRLRDTGESAGLIAGAEYSRWGGLALDEERVLLAGGPRGLLVLPQGFDRTNHAVAIPVGGECRDVLVADGRTWVLIGGGEDAVVELAWAETGVSAREVGRTPLAGSYNRLVR